MSVLTYVKGLPTPIDELNALGMTTFEMFLNEYSQGSYRASCETVNHLLVVDQFNKSSWNTHLQKIYGINKRQANGIIAYSEGRVKAAIEHRKLHLKNLKRKLKSVKSWLSTANKKLKSCSKFYAKKSWIKSETRCLLPLSCSVKYKKTNKSNLEFQVHNKNRKAHRLELLLTHLPNKPLRVKVPKSDIFVVGTKTETFGNQVCQWDGEHLKFRIPYYLESKYGKHVITHLGNFNRNINRIPEDGAKTWHFYIKDGKWKVALQFTPKEISRYSNHLSYGCIGIDLNPGSIDWAYVDWDGNLKQHGKFVLQQGLPRGKQQAQLNNVCLKLVQLATFFNCPIVCEELDFSNKKAELKEVSKKLARMLSGWAYSKFYELLNSICTNRGIQVSSIHPAYTSLIGLTKYLKMYGVSSGVAAAIAIARRGMRLSENLPCSITAYLSVNGGKHVWSNWNKLNKKLKTCTEIRDRHSYYGISNWDFLVKE